MSKHVYPLYIGMVSFVALLGCAKLNFLQPVSPGEAPPPEFDSANLYLFPDNATFTGETVAGALYDFCWPPHTADSGSGFLLVEENGGLIGECSSDSSDKTLHRTGKLSGRYDTLKNEVSFHLETSLIFVPHPEGKVTMVIVFDGTAPVTKNTASGTGNFVYTCSAEGKSVNCLGERTSLNLTGTMPFQLDFIQDP